MQSPSWEVGTAPVGEHLRTDVGDLAKAVDAHNDGEESTRQFSSPTRAHSEVSCAQQPPAQHDAISLPHGHGSVQKD